MQRNVSIFQHFLYHFNAVIHNKFFAYVFFERKKWWKWKQTFHFRWSCALVTRLAKICQAKQFDNGIIAGEWKDIKDFAQAFSLRMFLLNCHNNSKHVWCSIDESDPSSRISRTHLNGIFASQTWMNQLVLNCQFENSS